VIEVGIASPYHYDGFVYACSIDVSGLGGVVGVGFKDDLVAVVDVVGDYVIDGLFDSSALEVVSVTGDW
jgi:hypothetical protein